MRPPEMCDPYQRWVVNEKVDIWMLGCILFTLCFYKHPFQDEMSKLSIVNAAYIFPAKHTYSEKMLDLIREMLTPNPKFRPTIFEVMKLVENYFELDSIKLNPEAEKIKQESLKHQSEIFDYQKKAEERKIQKKKNDEVWIEFKETANKQAADSTAFDAFQSAEDNKENVSQKWNQFDFGTVQQGKAENSGNNRWAAPDFSNGNRNDDNNRTGDLFETFEKDKPLENEQTVGEKNNHDQGDLLGIEIKVDDNKVGSQGNQELI